MRFIGILAALLVMLGGLAARAEEPADAIPAMDVATLGSFVDRVTATVGQDVSRMGEAGSKRDCLALIGFANSFRLGHSYLGSADTRAKTLAGDAAMAIRAKGSAARSNATIARPLLRKRLRQIGSPMTPRPMNPITPDIPYSPRKSRRRTGTSARPVDAVYFTSGQPPSLTGRNTSSPGLELTTL